MFGPSIALAIGAKFVPLRKPKKLPGMPLCQNETMLAGPRNYMKFALYFGTVDLEFAYLLVAKVLVNEMLLKNSLIAKLSRSAQLAHVIFEFLSFY